MLNLPSYMRHESHDQLDNFPESKTSGLKALFDLGVELEDVPYYHPHGLGYGVEIGDAVSGWTYSDQVSHDKGEQINLRCADPYITKLVDLCKKISKLRHSSGVIIAGGAVRDTLLGRTVKDIDIFVQVKKQHFDSLFDDLFATEVDAADDENPYDGSFTVKNFMLDDFDEQLQLVNLKATPREHLKTFPIGLSMVYVDENGLHMTPEFLHDVNTRTINLLDRSDEKSDTNEEYLDRVHLKYPDFKTAYKPKEVVEVVQKKVTLADLKAAFSIVEADKVSSGFVAASSGIRVRTPGSLFE